MEGRFDAAIFKVIAQACRTVSISSLRYGPLHFIGANQCETRERMTRNTIRFDKPRPTRPRLLVLAAGLMGCAGLWWWSLPATAEAPPAPLPSASWSSSSPFVPGPANQSPASALPQAPIVTDPGFAQPAETEGGASALGEPAQTVGRDAALAGFASRLEAFQGRCRAGGTAGDCASALLRLDTELLQLIDSARVPQERALGWKAALLEIQFLAESERYAAMNRWFEQIPSTKWPALQVGHSQ
jgi:hypothetical protein